ncbi:MAG: 4-(cytidine 5'-diphospho)-2-C-methyl-D-erythritol kinase [Corynebacterium sp.]|nr:4-(cytidine 5'-diphospho)-2-C-methyl-D-erythritol kinase [Corynebacterium sp.]
MTTRTYTAFGKINLVLGVGPAREDGFHKIETIYQSISLHDTISFSPNEGQAHVLTVSGLDAANVPTDSSNLLIRALERINPEPEFYLDIHIEKGIPTAGGMAGGSADCAAGLKAANDIYGLNKTEEELCAIAAELGSDIPFCVVGGTQYGTGRGEILEAQPCPNTYHWVVAVSDTGLSTPEVFRKFDEMNISHEAFMHMTMGNVYRETLDRAFHAPTYEGSVLQLAQLMANDLERPALALRPELSEVLEFGKNNGAMRAMISGSGPTCIFLVSNEDAAANLVESFKNKGITAFAAHTEKDGVRSGS